MKTGERERSQLAINNSPHLVHKYKKEVTEL